MKQRPLSQGGGRQLAAPTLNLFANVPHDGSQKFDHGR
jgi:hypothetical protein